MGSYHQTSIAQSDNGIKTGFIFDPTVKSSFIITSTRSLKYLHC